VNGEAAMAEVCVAVTHCRFEATDAISDEVVLMKILTVLKTSLHHPLGQQLSDEVICGMMETAFSMCFQMRLSGK
jgi:brefeldin A-resistance guanine nucleotide exchange factor 1